MICTRTGNRVSTVPMESPRVSKHEKFFVPDWKWSEIAFLSRATEEMAQVQETTYWQDYL
jgi:hypothetical protein